MAAGRGGQDVRVERCSPAQDWSSTKCGGALTGGPPCSSGQARAVDGVAVAELRRGRLAGHVEQYQRYRSCPDQNLWVFVVSLVRLRCVLARRPALVGAM